MRLILAALSVAALTLAACQPGEKSSEQTETAAAAQPPAPPPTDEQAQAMLASLPAPYNAADLANGRKQFARCRSCHTVVEGGANMTGPNLYGVFGRKIASKPGYNYSPAAREADFVWDGEKLDEWLADPRGFLPGNKMAFAGLKDEEDRRDLIAWLHTQTGYKPG